MQCLPCLPEARPSTALPAAAAAFNSNTSRDLSSARLFVGHEQDCVAHVVGRKTRCLHLLHKRHRGHGTPGRKGHAGGGRVQREGHAHVYRTSSGQYAPCSVEHQLCTLPASPTPLPASASPPLPAALLWRRHPARCRVQWAQGGTSRASPHQVHRRRERLGTAATCRCICYLLMYSPPAIDRPAMFWHTASTPLPCQARATTQRLQIQPHLCHILRSRGTSRCWHQRSRRTDVSACSRAAQGGRQVGR